jgi:hypothetical protein
LINHKFNSDFKSNSFLKGYKKDMSMTFSITHIYIYIYIYIYKLFFTTLLPGARTWNLISPFLSICSICSFPKGQSYFSLRRRMSLAHAPIFISASIPIFVALHLCLRRQRYMWTFKQNSDVHIYIYICI